MMTNNDEESHSEMATRDDNSTTRIINSDPIIDDESDRSTYGYDNSEEEYESEEDHYCWLQYQPENHKAAAEPLFNLDRVLCPLCFCEAEPGTALKLPSCSHPFCVDCFHRYIQAQIGAGKADCIECPIPTCKQPVETEILREILDDKEYEKLLRCSQSAFVLKNPDYHHCPTPNCSNVVYHKVGNGLPIVDCFRCQKVSCLKCGGSPYHKDRSCEEWKTYQEAQRRHRHNFPHVAGGRCVDRSRAGEEKNYEFDVNESILENIKRCRRCGNGIEHSDGCFKMKCRCGYRFCFQCGSENAVCSCTGANHGFKDNVTGRTDFAGLAETESYT